MIYKGIYSIKSAHKQPQRISRAKHEGLKEKTLDGLSMIHAFAALLWSTTEIIHKLQTLESRDVGPGLSENNLTSA